MRSSCLIRRFLYTALLTCLALLTQHSITLVEAFKSPPLNVSVKSILTVLSSSIMSSSSSPFISRDEPVLVVGATGKVGRKVVQQLMAENRPVRALVRNTEKAREIFGTSTSFEYPRLTIIKADIGKYDEYEKVLDEAVQGCGSIISVMGAVRFSKLTDFLPWRLLSMDAKWAGRDHPYYGNYLGQKFLIELAEKHDVKRFVRLTGLGLAYPAYNPFSILFNTLLSLNNKWGVLCEQALYKSKVPFVILRPGGLTDQARKIETTYLQIDVSGKLPFPGRVGRDDVASLAVQVLNLAAPPQSYTLACRWCGQDVKPRPQGFKEEGFATAAECLDNLTKSKVQSPPPPKMKPYGLVVGTVVYTLAAIAIKLLILLWSFVGKALHK